MSQFEIGGDKRIYQQLSMLVLRQHKARNRIPGRLKSGSIRLILERGMSMYAIKSFLTLGMVISSLVLFGGDARVSAPLDQRPISELLKTNETLFRKYSKDFQDLGKGAPPDEVCLVLRELQAVAEETEMQLHAMSVLVEIHDNASTEADRTKIREVIHREAQGYSNNVDGFIGWAMLYPVYTRRLQVKTEAGQMQEDLKRVKNLFDSLQVNTQATVPPPTPPH